MTFHRSLFISCLLAVATSGAVAVDMARSTEPDAEVHFAEVCDGRINLVPKFGLRPKCKALLDLDQAFLDLMDRDYDHDRRKASMAVSQRGWEHFRSGDIDTGMKRFNQAWLLDSTNAVAIWGMGAIQGRKEQWQSALMLFDEARGLIGGNLRFRVDHARLLAVAGIELKNDQLLNRAFAAFDSIHRDVPQDTANLQNWAMALYMTGRIEDAWSRLQEALRTPGAKMVSVELINEIEARRTIAK
ncbi:hypothetical protein AACH10_20840 [Ideonella sp. DXS22W]|uniref:Tetratricopeptide repeat protein n=1 Tax=Pseudaquabacterium inlustre TaxID=2984192 RepID=A0ABU9CPS1_9BURK